MSYEDQTNDQLRTELERRGLSTAGNKDDLVARLELDDAESAGDAPPDEPEPEPIPGGRTTASTVTGVPVQKRDENQDPAIKGRVVNERGDPAP